MVLSIGTDENVTIGVNDIMTIYEYDEEPVEEPVEVITPIEIITPILGSEQQPEEEEEEPEMTATACFAAGAIVTTDQGDIPIEMVTKKHTIPRKRD